jgi:hypothetical protein
MLARWHLQEEGLPAAGVVEISFRPVHPFASIFPFARAGRGANSVFLYSAVFGYRLGTTQLAMSGIAG